MNDTKKEGKTLYSDENLSRTEDPATTRTARGRFRQGRSGNPRGGPRGSLNVRTLAARALLEGQAEAITQKVLDRAMAGDSVALRLSMERITPPLRGTWIQLDLPPMQSAEDVPRAIGAVVQAAAESRITLEEAEKMVRLIEAQHRAMETDDLEDRIERLEEQLKASGSSNGSEQAPAEVIDRILEIKKGRTS